jgi:crossover junction endodeoxyribonuclease RusA
MRRYRANQTPIPSVYTFTVPGQPRPKPRPRVTKYGTYMPEGYVTYKAIVGACFRDRYPGDHLSTTEWWLSLEFHVRPTTRGDCDNLAGGIMDALEGVVWDNDRQVQALHVRKIYDVPKGKKPWTQVRMAEFDLSCSNAE